MITAIDTNILLDILVPNEEFFEASATALQEAASDRGFYRKLFPSLMLQDPTDARA